MLNLLGAGVLSISSSLLFPFFAHATVIYQNDFSSDPHIITDDSAGNHWEQATSALAFRTIHGPQTGVPDRYSAIPTSLDSSHSFTLTWRQMMTNSTPSAVVPFGILNSALVGQSSSSPSDDGYASVFSGNFQGNSAYIGHRVFPKNAYLSEAGNSHTSQFLIEQGKWYQGKLVYDADAQSISYLYTKEEEGMNINIRQGGPYTGYYRPIIFGTSTHYIGMSMYAVSEHNSVSESYPGSAEGFIDDVKLEDDTVIVPSSTRPILSFSSSTPYNGVRGVSPEKGVPNDTVFTFKTVFTDSANHAPSSVVAILGSTTLTMTLDTNASSSLHDGDYRNGEAYTATTTIGTLGTTTYSFTASSGFETTTLAGPAPITQGYSSVAFFPGIKASYLYGAGTLGDAERWLPNIGVGGNGDIAHLNMNPDGTSVDNSIYTKDGDIILNAYNVQPVYQGFPEAMNALVADGTIQAWKPIAYDWRLSYVDILARGIMAGDHISYLDATDTPYIYNEIRKLADTSLSGKVTIIAHSNGGLLAKAFLADLEARHDPLLQKIDLLVLVAVPQLGTPKALLPTLHGAENELSVFPTWINDSYMRRASQFTPGAYSLLPSQKYFTQTANAGYGPIVKFSSTLNALAETIRYRDQLGYTSGSIASVFDYRNRYGSDIDSYAELSEYLRGVEGRKVPAFDDVENPVLLSQTLLNNANSTHDVLDNWKAPDINNDGIPDIKVVQIAGLGLSTIRGVEYNAYKTATGCVPATGTCGAFYGAHADPLFEASGDGTVVLSSATLMPVETYYVNLKGYNGAKIDPSGVKTREHSNLMGSQSILSTVNDLVKHMPVTNIPYVTQTAPQPGDLLVLEMHSPVAMDVYDNKGGHLGKKVDVVTGVTYIENTIPNAAYMTVGESTYITLDPTSTSTVKLDGLATGTFTLKLKKYVGSTLTSTTTYSDVPVTAALLGQFNLGPSASLPTLPLDTNGDGTVDITVAKDGTPIATSQSLLKDFRTAITPMVMSAAIKNTLVLLSQTTEQLIVSKKIPLAKLSVTGMEFIIKERTNRGILKIDADMLLAILTKVKLLLK